MSIASGLRVATGVSVTLNAVVLLLSTSAMICAVSGESSSPVSAELSISSRTFAAIATGKLPVNALNIRPDMPPSAAKSLAAITPSFRSAIIVEIDGITPVGFPSYAGSGTPLRLRVLSA